MAWLLVALHSKWFANMRVTMDHEIRCGHFHTPFDNGPNGADTRNTGKLHQNPGNILLLLAFYIYHS